MAKKSSILDALTDAAQRKFGENAYMGKDSELYLTGILLHHLSLRWLFNSNVLPVSKVIRLYGVSRSQKSTFGFELLRLFGEAGCEALAYIENEGGKFSPLLLRSVLAGHEVLITNTRNVEEAQTALTTLRKTFQTKCPKRDQLAAFLLDSLFGSSTEEKHKAVDKDGHTSRAYASEAMLWSSFIQTYTGEIMGWPIAFILTNHLKEDTGEDKRAFGPKKMRTPGGAAQKFYSAIDIRLQREDKPEMLQTLAYQGNVISQPHKRVKVFMRVDKSSIGDDTQNLNVDLKYWNDQDNKQITFFDWWGADARLFASMVMGGDRAPQVADRAALAAICDVKVDRNRYTSETLGLKGVTDHEFGWALLQRPELVEQISHEVGIKPHPVFDGKMPSAIQEASKKKEKSVSVPVNVPPSSADPGEIT